MSTKFCAYHNNIAAVSCEKFRCDAVAKISNAKELDFGEILNWDALTLSETLPGWCWERVPYILQ